MTEKTNSFSFLFFFYQLGKTLQLQTGDEIPRMLTQYNANQRSSPQKNAFVKEVLIVFRGLHVVLTVSTYWTLHLPPTPIIQSPAHTNIHTTATMCGVSAQIVINSTHVLH